MTLMDFGKGRMDRFRRTAATLEQFDGTAWTLVGRFGSVRDADVALDDAVAHGVHPDHLRATQAGSTLGARMVTLLGCGVVAAAIAWWIYIFIVGP